MNGADSGFSGPPVDHGEVTRLLARFGSGDAAAQEALLSIIYDELRGVAARRLQGDGKDHTLQPTALVHEAFLKLAGGAQDWKSRGHFFAVAATAMRQILRDHARAKNAAKRSGKLVAVTLDGLPETDGAAAVDLVALDGALEKLAELDPRQARVVELRFFGGLDAEEVADQLGVSSRTVFQDWRHARAWLYRELS